MPLDLTAGTPQGARLVALAERLAADAGTRAGAHDRDGSHPHRSFEALREAGYLTAPIPERLGGLGVTSVHDLVVASSRLARGDASVAIGANMHWSTLEQLVRLHAVAEAAGDERRAPALAATLAATVTERTVIAAAISEAGQDLMRPVTRAVRAGAGWRVDGRKVFCTMSPAASVFYTSVSLEHDDGTARYAFARIPADAPGVVVHDDWDALGMRASGSHTVSFTGVPLPRGAVTAGFAAGDPVPYMSAYLAAGLFHAAASLGIAEAADRTVRGTLVARRNGGPDARTTVLVGESAVELAACRAALARGASLVDAHYAAHPAHPGPGEAIVELFAETQAVKTFVNEAAVRIVDRALACSGGAGYLNGSPLSRAYRDVRAGAFMHPLGANRAYELLARTALGASPALA